MMANRFTFWTRARNWPIRTKLLVGFGLVLVVAIGFAIPNLINLVSARSAIESAITEGLQIQELGNKIQTDLASARREEQEFRVTWQSEGYESARSLHLAPHEVHIATIRSSLNDLDKLTAGHSQDTQADINADVKKLGEELDTYRNEFNSTADLLGRRGAREEGAVGRLERASLALGSNLRSVTDVDLTEPYYRVRLSELAYRTTANSNDLYQTEFALQRVRIQLDGLSSNQKEWLTSLVDAYERELNDLGTLDEEIQTHTQLYTAASNNIRPLALAITANGTNIAKEQLDHVVATTRNAQRSLMLSLVVSVGLGLLLSILLTRQISNPIRALTQAALEIGRGNLSAQAQVQTGDETGTLATAFNNMTTQLRDLIGSLEARVEARTAQLRASAEVARAVSSILDPQELMQQTAELIRERFNFYYVGVFVLDQDQHYAWLRAGTGAAGQKMLASGHRLDATPGGHSMVGWVCANKRARIALDVGHEAERFANPLLPNTRSELALPLQVGGRILGALDVQSEREAAFEESDVAVLQSMADQIAIALENAHLFSQAQSTIEENKRLVDQIQANLQEATTLGQVGQAIAIAQDTQAIFQVMVEYILQPDIDLCLLILFDPYQTDLPENLEIAQAWSRTGTQVGQKRYSFSNFPWHELLSASQTTITQKTLLSPVSRGMPLWEQLAPTVQTLAFVPLQVGQRWTGALGLGASITDAFEEDQVRRYQTIASQVSISIENRRLVESAQASLQELSAVYRRATREAWGAALQAKPELAEFSYAQPAQASGDEAAWRVPLRVREQEIGILELGGQPRSLTEQERAVVEAVATQAALALDSARLFDETQRLAGRERLINEITARIRATTSVPAILKTAARELALALNVPHAVARLSPKTDQAPDSRAGLSGGGDHESI